MLALGRIPTSVFDAVLYANDRHDPNPTSDDPTLSCKAVMSGLVGKYAGLTDQNGIPALSRKPVSRASRSAATPRPTTPARPEECAPERRDRSHAAHTTTPTTDWTAGHTR